MLGTRTRWHAPALARCARCCCVRCGQRGSERQGAPTRPRRDPARSRSARRPAQATRWRSPAAAERRLPLFPEAGEVVEGVGGLEAGAVVGGDVVVVVEDPAHAGVDERLGVIHGADYHLFGLGGWGSDSQNGQNQRNMAQSAAECLHYRNFGVEPTLHFVIRANRLSFRQAPS